MPGDAGQGHPLTPRRPSRADPFAPLAPLLSQLGRAPLPPVLVVVADDEWVAGEAVRRAAASFTAAFPEGEVSEYDGTGLSVKEAVADAATVALFATNRLVVLDASELLHARKLTADEIDALLDEAEEAGGEVRVLDRLARKARALATSAGVSLEGELAEAARKMTGRVKRGERAPELAALLSRGGDEGESTETALDRLLDYAARASAGDNALLLAAVSPDPGHAAIERLRHAPTATLLAPDGEPRRERLEALGLERAIDRQKTVEPDVFDILTERGRLSARAFLSELDRLIDSASGTRVTAESAARLIADERREYGSDFVEAVARRRFLDALKILDRLMSSTEEFSAFRPSGSGAAAPARKGPKGEAAFFPLLGLLTGEVRRMLTVKVALAQSGLGAGRRADYRSFVDRLLPSLKAHRPGSPPVAVDGHPFALHKSYLASFDWTLSQLIDALRGLEAVDRGVKSGLGSGPELIENFLLQRVAPSKGRGV